MVVRFGRTVPAGFLPVFSVETEDEARALLGATCSRGGLPGEDYVSRELAAEQSLERLYGFGHKLAIVYGAMHESGHRERLKARSSPATPTKAKRSPR